MLNFIKKSFTLIFLFTGIISAQTQNYNPLSIQFDFKINKVSLTVHDAERNREIPLMVYLPSVKTPAPVILFSHGLGGTYEAYTYLGEHWSARGYICIFIQHHGSDDLIWKDKQPSERLKALKEAAGLPNFLLRVKDVSVVIDYLEKFNNDKSNPLFNMMNLDKIGMAGHSFGAVTTQAVSGEAFRRGISFAEKRIKAAFAMSPSSPENGNNLAEAFSKVKIPWMVMTGTKDIVPSLGNLDAKSRLAVFENLPAGDKYEIVLYNGEHSAFTNRALPGDKEKRNPNHHKVILGLSTAFWDAYLYKNNFAKDWLKKEGPFALLEKNDEWKNK